MTPTSSSSLSNAPSPEPSNHACPIAAAYRCLAATPDPRTRRLHLVGDVLFAAACAMVAGANCFTAMAEFAAAKLAWLRLYAPLENGAPSHDTFRYVFLLLKPTCFHAQLREALGEAVIKPGQHIAADGKSMRGTASPTWQKGALHVLRAYVNQSGLSILYQPQTS